MKAGFKFISSTLLAAVATAAMLPSAYAAEVDAAAAPSPAEQIEKAQHALTPPLPSADPNAPAKSFDPLNDIDKMTVVPLRGLAMVRNKHGQTVLISDTGRFVMTNVQILDTWNKGAILTTPEQVEYYGDRFDPTNVRVNGLSTLHFGTGKTKFTAFVDPRCHFCHELYAFAQAHEAEVDATFILLPILGPESEALARRMTCMASSKKPADEKTAALALLSGDYTKLGTDEKCDQTALRANIVTASVLGIHGVPFVYADDGRFTMGLPQPDAITWVNTVPAPVEAKTLASIAKKGAN
ncbi:MAG: hypothetical protein E6Q76_07465 [Rhizobium sp.]|nr:MAG: hypothetical protein E6Q76_07465 [Rhizobium sp.]